MPYFVATYRYTPDTALRDRVRPTHREWLSGLGDTLVLSGPTDADGAFLVFEAEDAAAVERTVAQDPFTTEGVIAESTVVGWTPVKGRLVERL
ncbi:YciI family protein [Kineococcus sp. SYSU DK004]|uniref:YciI family protein n=1 Tax=Kineococcus sp. SYSU DK004 TaxID=3383125 RepID=UPI003D7E5055